MNREDEDLGADHEITRREFVAGAAALSGAAAIYSPGAEAAAQMVAGGGLELDKDHDYPPIQTGLVGDGPNSFPNAHALRDGKVFPKGEDTGETYDLIVIGAGISGLAAAWFFREQHPSARILVLDNTHDVGGHARRCEFVHDGKMYLSPGGSDFFVNYHTWPNDALRLIKKLGIQPFPPGDRTYSDHFASLGMHSATFFKKEIYGRDQLVRGTFRAPTPEFYAQAPLPEHLKQDLQRLMSDPKVDYLPAGMTVAERIEKLRHMSYRNYLLRYVKVHPDIIDYVGGVWCITEDTSSAWFAFFRYKPGFAGLGIERPAGSPESPEHERFDWAPPGGNSSTCRLIIRDLIPDSLAPGNIVDVETERLNYGTLDRPGQPARIRLKCTVIGAKHLGQPPVQFQPDTRVVEVTYATTAGRVYRVRGDNVVMAGYNAMLPYICPELPEPQKAALRKGIRAINEQTIVLLRNWEAFQRLKTSGIALARSPLASIRLKTPRAFGKMQPTLDPSQPILADLYFSAGIANRAFYSELLDGRLPPPGTPLRVQWRLARSGYLRKPFEWFERTIRSDLARVLGPGGFDPARDILAITFNRWGHGYAQGVNVLFDDENETPPYVVGRRKFGKIAIANTDASGIDNFQTGIDMAARAVRELEPKMYGYYGEI